ncbi:MAG: ParB/RepB/Spo0J family partition protein [Clostridia bacterium]|nr:ParB/RepB/Spo0J family partition protein [Clostridia bacterium]MBQ5833344.1 ParB/RepB/Spo0J family partition protein [Clostridia bacterium]
MAKARSGLGRDFYSLLDDNILASDKSSAATNLRISEVEPRSDQPRKTFTTEALEQLADSIAQFGVLQPIIVRESTLLQGSYEIIAGERRWRAAKMAGLSEIPAVILDGDELKAAQVAVIENVQREDLNPLEEALAYSTLIDRFHLTQDQVAKQVGKSRPAIANMLRLLDLPDEVLELLRQGNLSAGHARALLGLNNPEQMLSLAEKIVEKDLSVRDVERTIRLMNYEPDAQDGEEQTALTQRKAYMHDLEHRAVSRLGRKVRILKTAKKKVVELAYSDDDDLEALLRSICGADFFADEE